MYPVALPRLLLFIVARSLAPLTLLPSIPTSLPHRTFFHPFCHASAPHLTRIASSHCCCPLSACSPASCSHSIQRIAADAMSAPPQPPPHHSRAPQHQRHTHNSPPPRPQALPPPPPPPHLSQHLYRHQRRPRPQPLVVHRGRDRVHRVVAVVSERVLVCVWWVMPSFDWWC